MNFIWGQWQDKNFSDFITFSDIVDCGHIKTFRSVDYLNKSSRTSKKKNSQLKPWFLNYKNNKLHHYHHLLLRCLAINRTTILPARIWSICKNSRKYHTLLLEMDFQIYIRNYCDPTRKKWIFISQKYGLKHIGINETNFFFYSK